MADGDDDGEAGLERQRARIEALFRGGWVPSEAPEAGPSPERTPFIRGVGDDAEIVVRGSGAGRQVVVLFSHQLFPGRRFGHRFPPPSSPRAQHAAIGLMEEIETGALRRLMADPPAEDEAGIIWTTWPG